MDSRQYGDYHKPEAEVGPVEGHVQGFPFCLVSDQTLGNLFVDNPSALTGSGLGVGAGVTYTLILSSVASSEKKVGTVKPNSYKFALHIVLQGCPFGC
jgi:hypothetical protein